MVSHRQNSLFYILINDANAKPLRNLVKPWFRSGFVVVSPWFRSGFAVVLQWFRGGFAVVSRWFRNGFAVVSQLFRASFEPTFIFLLTCCHCDKFKLIGYLVGNV